MTEPCAAARPEPAAGALRTGLMRWACLCAGLTGWRRLIVAIALGGTASLALPPVYAAPLLLLCVPPVLWLLDGVKTRWGAFAVGWGFGFGLLVFSLYWIAFALTVEFWRFFWMIPFAAAGLPAALAIFTGAATAAVFALRLSGLARILAFALLWAVSEWLRGHVLTGFPWNLIGYAWVGWPALLQSVSVIGVYGLTLLTLLLACAPAGLIDQRSGDWSRGGIVAFALLLLAFLGMAAAGSWRLGHASDEMVPGVMLRLVQPSIPQVEKWDPEFRLENFLQHRALSVTPGARPVTHVIWPETAVLYSLTHDEAAREAIAAVTPPGGVTLTGAPRFSAPGEEPAEHWNSLIAIDANAEVIEIYDKSHLVPFGEYVPLRGVLPLETVAASRLDYSAGSGIRTLEVPGLPPFSPLICYEVIFPGSVVTTGADNSKQPEWLLNITNDAWFGETAGPHQHFAIAQTRAVEEGMPLVRVASTGISGVVDAYGRTVATLGLGQHGILDVSLPAALPSATPYSKWRDRSFWLMACGLTIIVLISAWRQPKVLAS